MPVVIKRLCICVLGTLIMALYQFYLANLEHQMMIFVQSGLRKACSLELLYFKTLQNQVKGYYHDLVWSNKFFSCTTQPNAFKGYEAAQVHCQSSPTYPRYVFIDKSVNIKDKYSKWTNSTSITHMHKSQIWGCKANIETKD